jgi:hypothetical protein
VEVEFNAAPEWTDERILNKRSVVGTYHLISIKHLDELEHRFNNRKNQYLFRDTLLKLITAQALPYRELVQAA